MTKIYLLKSRHHFFAYKIGISNNVKRRVAQIQKSSNIRVSVVLSLPLLFAYRIEQILHRVYKFNRVKSIRGSGGTEWFFFLVPISPIVLFLFFFAAQILGAVLIFYSLIKLTLLC